MEAITLRELMEATGGKLCGEFNDLDVQITGAESDNRKIAAGDVFFAFPGEKADGHRFAGAALEAGAVGCVISKEPESFIDGKFYLMVEDTILAYGDLARYYRSKFNIPVIGVTGSVGKTTTKDMIASVLAQKYNTLKTEGNFNNNIGLPRTILRITSETQIAVIEMGMNHFGEIDYLAGIARPDAAVITNVGDAHIGNLGSRQGIFQAKSEIFNGLKEGGYAVMNADDEYLRQLKDDGEIAIVVCAGFQNRGIGRRCVREMVALAREQGMREVRANIYSFNARSQRMFQSVGFEQIDEEWHRLCL